MLVAQLRPETVSKTRPGGGLVVGEAQTSATEFEENQDEPCSVRGLDITGLNFRSPAIACFLVSYIRSAYRQRPWCAE